MSVDEDPEVAAALALGAALDEGDPLPWNEAPLALLFAGPTRSVEYVRSDVFDQVVEALPASMRAHPMIAKLVKGVSDEREANRG